MAAMTAWSGPIHDPQMGLDDGSLSDPITTNTVFGPGPNGGGAFGFYNPTGQFIIGLTFNATLLPDLSFTTQQLANTFSCNDASTPGFSNPFFLDCAVNYAASSGLLTVRFFGVNPGDFDPGQSEVGEHEGIPPLLAGCIDHPDSAGCTSVGHFIVTLNDNYVPVGDNGGWSTAKTPGLFPPDGPDFTVTEIDVAPEPATAAMVMGALAFLALAAYAARRRTAPPTPARAGQSASAPRGCAARD